MEKILNIIIRHNAINTLLLQSFADVKSINNIMQRLCSKSKVINKFLKIKVSTGKGHIFVTNLRQTKRNA